MFLNNKYNGYEDELFRNILDKNNLSNKTFHYEKIFNHTEGNKFYKRLSDYKNVDILSIVVNFVDILGHSRSESNILKELIPNESAYRSAVFNWFNNSWLKDCLFEFSDWDADIIITSDHGNTIVSKPSRVKADNTVSLGVRYKYGRNLNVNPQAPRLNQNEAPGGATKSSTSRTKRPTGGRERSRQSFALAKHCTFNIIVLGQASYSSMGDTNSLLINW